MAEETNVNTQTPDNPANSGAAAATVAAGAQSASAQPSDQAAGTTPGNGADSGEKPEFSDPNMQKAWTEKTQKLAEERKTWEAERETFNQSKAELERKAAILEKLDADEEVRNFVLNKYGIKTEKQGISPEELLEAQQDPEKMAAIIQREVDRKIMPISQNVKNLELENAIQSYAEAPGNEDFWELHKSGLLKAQMLAVRTDNPKLKEIDVISKAHKDTRSVLNSMKAKIEKEIADKAAAITLGKIDGLTDKGGKTSVPSTKSFKGKSITEIYNTLKT